MRDGQVGDDCRILEKGASGNVEEEIFEAATAIPDPDGVLESDAEGFIAWVAVHDDEKLLKSENLIHEPVQLTAEARTKVENFDEDDKKEVADPTDS